MTRPLLYIVLFPLFLCSCKPGANTIAGVYQQQNMAPAKLILKKDRTFEFAGKKTAMASSKEILPTNLNFITSGTWELKNDQLLLNSFVSDSAGYENGITDSITRFTSITSFNFWNQYGDPVYIRSILLPSSRTKPHFGNSLYLFAQDFKPKDTVVFHFDGYPDFKYPGSIPYAIGNNIHKIILREPYLPAAFSNTALLTKKNKLVAAGNKTVFTKMN